MLIGAPWWNTSNTNMQIKSYKKENSNEYAYWAIKRMLSRIVLLGCDVLYGVSSEIRTLSTVPAVLSSLVTRHEAPRSLHLAGDQPRIRPPPPGGPRDVWPFQGEVWKAIQVQVKFSLQILSCEWFDISTEQRRIEDLPSSLRTWRGTRSTTCPGPPGGWESPSSLTSLSRSLRASTWADTRQRRQ